MQGLPVAGKDSTIGSPYEYGQFQSFLPEIKAEGQNPMATGLRPDMFQFKSPTGVTAGGSGGGADAMRDVLAKLSAIGTAGSGAAGGVGGGDFLGGGAGGGGFLGGGAGGGAGGGGGGVAFPLPQTGATGGAGAFIGGPGGGNMGQMHPAFNQPGVAGQTAFAPWAGTNIRAGGAGGEQAIDWRTRDAGPLIDQPKIGF
jgi:hypothetical protein